MAEANIEADTNRKTGVDGRQRRARTLLEEAEHRVRMGERPVKVMRALNIPPATFHRWAARGFWRQIDLRREEQGLPRLELAHYARPGCGTTDNSRGVKASLSSSPAQPTTTHDGEDVPSDLASLLDAAEARGAEALNCFRSGHTSQAEAKLKDAERLARLHRRLLAYVPRQPSPDELAHRRIAEMSREEMIEEIIREATAAHERQNGPG